MNKLIDRTNEISTNKEGLVMQIIKYINHNNITVLFNDGYSTTSAYKEFKNGSIKNPYYKNIYEVGYLGEGKYHAKRSGKERKIYKIWNAMMRRCYCDKVHENHPTYKGCTVCDKWHNFQNFGLWYDENFYQIDSELMCLDKDILTKGNKVYSPETCVFVPENINALFTKTDALRGKYPIGVYYKKRDKKYVAQCNIGKGNQKYVGGYNTPEDAFYIGYKPFKEKIIKQIADKYKDKIPKKLYDAMYSYKVEITD